MNDYSYPRGVDGGEIVEKYALYRETDKLTDCKYDSIVRVDGGFDCVYLEDGVEKHDFFAADDIAPESRRAEMIVLNGSFYIG